MNPTQKQDHSTPLADITPADILRGAARYLELHGWIQGSYYPADTTEPFPPACTVGALNMAAFGETDPAMRFNRPEWPLFLGAQRVLLNYLERADLLHTNDGDLVILLIHDWNDETDRTATEVITILRDAADDYDWTHATEDDLETYADACAWAEKHPTREGFLAWLGAR